MPNDLELTAYAATLEIVAAKSRPGTEWEQALVKFFDTLARLCEEHGVQAIGHMKGFLKLYHEAGYCYFSTTGALTGTQSQGQFNGKASKGTLDFNVLVYGIDQSIVEQISNEAAQHLQHEIQGNYFTLELINQKQSM